MACYEVSGISSGVFCLNVWVWTSDILYNYLAVCYITEIPSVIPYDIFVVLFPMQSSLCAEKTLLYMERFVPQHNLVAVNLHYILDVFQASYFRWILSFLMVAASDTEKCPRFVGFSFRCVPAFERIIQMP
jgi:hypothetical protein